MVDESNYQKYRGKCKEFCEELVKKCPDLRMVRGHYWDPIWNRDEPHWWCVDKDGVINDPTRFQFPSGGVAEYYTEFDGNVDCAECSKTMKEDDASFYGNYAFCSSKCTMRFVGL